MNDWKELNNRFREVYTALKEQKEIAAYIKAWEKPWKFYREHTAKEAIEILIKEAGAHDNV